MSTILLESQTLAPFKLRVMITSQNNKNNLKFYKFLQIFCWRKRWASRSWCWSSRWWLRWWCCCCCWPSSPPTISTGSPTKVGEAWGANTIQFSWLCHFETNGSEAGGVGVRQIFRLDAPGLSPPEILHSDYVWRSCSFQASKNWKWEIWLILKCVKSYKLLFSSLLAAILILSLSTKPFFPVKWQKTDR